MCGGAHHAHGVDVREAPQRSALVRDAVLHARDGDARRCDGSERVECVDRVLALHGEEDDVVVAPVDLVRGGHGVDPHDDATVDVVDTEPVRADGVEVRAPRQQDHVVAVLVEPPADHTADGAGAVHDISHDVEPRIACGRWRPRSPRPGTSTRRATIASGEPCSVARGSSSPSDLAFVHRATTSPSTWPAGRSSSWSTTTACCEAI